MRIKMGLLLLIMMTVATFGLGTHVSQAASNWPSKIVFAYLPNEEAADADMKKGRDMLMKDMTNYLKVPVDIVICEDYNAVIETMKNQKCQIASFGPFSYIIAHDRSKAESICVSATDPSNAVYYSYLVSHVSTGIKTMQDIKGKRMSFVDPASTSGNLVPRAMMVAKLKVKTDEIDKMFSSVQFAGNHMNSLLAAANKSVDVAAVSSSTFNQAIERGMIKKEDLTIIIKSDPIPSSPIAMYGGLPSDLKAKIRSFFLTYNNPEYFKLRKTPGQKFIEMKDANYNGIRKISKDMKLSPDDLLKG